MNNKQSGDLGEKEIVDLVLCPNCGKKLMLLPQSYPLFDVQCTACSFRAQIKTNRGKPKNEIFGAGWDILEKTLKAGYLVPPLLVYFKWTKDNDIECHEIRFYPFIPRVNIKKRILHEGSRRAGYKMYNYTNIDKIPYFIVSSINASKQPVGGVPSFLIEISERKFIK